jgi:pimeloyl-ACP methyl ester carboxylesterase
MDLVLPPGRPMMHRISSTILLLASLLGVGSAAPAYKTTFVQADPARLRVLSAGTGPTLVLLPGQGRPPQDLEPLAALLVAGGYRAMLPEPRGMGQSTGPLDGITLHDLARDVAAVISASHGAPAVLIGHGLGNRIARTVAADRPELVRAVVLLSASGKVQPSAEVARALELAAGPDTPPDARRKAAMTAWFARGNDPTPWLTGWSQPVRAAYRAAAAATPTGEFWTAGRAPVLIVQGLEDVSAPPENGRLLKQELGDRARLVEIPGVGHALPLENPGAVARAVLEYLSTMAHSR